MIRSWLYLLLFCSLPTQDYARPCTHSHMQVTTHSSSHHTPNLQTICHLHPPVFHPYFVLMCCNSNSNNMQVNKWTGHHRALVNHLASWCFLFHFIHSSSVKSFDARHNVRSPCRPKNYITKEKLNCGVLKLQYCTQIRHLQVFQCAIFLFILSQIQTGKYRAVYSNKQKLPVFSSNNAIQDPSSMTLSTV